MFDVFIVYPLKQFKCGRFKGPSPFIAIIQAGPNVVELYGTVGEKSEIRGHLAKKIGLVGDFMCDILYRWMVSQNHPLNHKRQKSITTTLQFGNSNYWSSLQIGLFLSHPLSHGSV